MPDYKEGKKISVSKGVNDPYHFEFLIQSSNFSTRSGGESLEVHFFEMAYVT